MVIRIHTEGEKKTFDNPLHIQLVKNIGGRKYHAVADTKVWVWNNKKGWEQEFTESVINDNTKHSVKAFKLIKIKKKGKTLYVPYVVV